MHNDGRLRTKFTEWAGAVTEDDPILSLLNDEEAAFDAMFKVHHYVGDLRGREFGQPSMPGGIEC